MSQTFLFLATCYAVFAKQLQKLRVIKPYIEALPEKGQKAERSLRNFKNRKKRLEWLIDQINIIDLEGEINSVDHLEAECTYYWYSYQERKTYWEKALGNPATLPSKDLHYFQTLLVGEINPDIDVDIVIKQSQIVDLMKKIEFTLESHEAIKTNILSLKTELNLVT